MCCLVECIIVEVECVVVVYIGWRDFLVYDWEHGVVEIGGVFHFGGIFGG